MANDTIQTQEIKHEDVDEFFRLFDGFNPEDRNFLELAYSSIPFITEDNISREFRKAIIDDGRWGYVKEIIINTTTSNGISPRALIDAAEAELRS